MNFIKLLKYIYSFLPKKLVLPLINAVLIRFITIEKHEFKKGPVTIVGMLRAAVGIGKAGRLTLEALKNMGMNLTSFDVSHIFVNQFLKINLPPQIKANEGGVIIVQLNPIHLPIVLFLIGKARLQRKKIILYSVWELETIPNSWIAPCKLAHEIWVPSKFVLDAFKKSVKCIKIKMVPHFFTKPASIKSDGKILHGRVVALSVLHIDSGFSRKNILDVIEVFKRLPASHSASLLIKVSGTKGNEKYLQMIQYKIHDNPNIHLITETLTDKKMQTLMIRADIVISLHRSEGFGLILAEGMWLKKAMLVTGWSGNATFLPKDTAMCVNYKLVPVVDDQGTYMSECKWAQPDLEDATNKLTLLIKSKSLRDKLGKKAYSHARRFFSRQNFDSWVDRSLEEEGH